MKKILLIFLLTAAALFCGCELNPDDYVLLSPEEICGVMKRTFGDEFTLVGASDVDLNIYVSVNVDIDRFNPYSASEKDEIKSKVEQAINVYVNGGIRRNGEYHTGLLIGEDFIPHKLSVFLDKEVPEIKNIIVNQPTSVIEIKNEEKGSTKDITVEIL